MTTYVLPRRLTAPAWEDHFGPGQGPFTAAGRWSRRVVRHGLRLDFSRVEFADPAALARALLLLDAAVREGIPATVVLPTSALAIAEQEHIARSTAAQRRSFDAVRARLNRRARRRGDARAFMRQVGFESALRPEHWPAGAVSIIDGSGRPNGERLDSAGPGRNSVGPATGSEDQPYRQRRMLPFQWVSTAAEDQRGRVGFLHSAVAALRDIDVSRSDAHALSQAVLAELVRNVEAHAAVHGGPRPAALVGAMLVDAETYRSRGDDLSTEAHDLIEAASSTESHVLRLVVGDSGVGLVARLTATGATAASDDTTPPDGWTSSAAAIFRSFDRWSAGSHDTEARGLWRVARLVRRYRGRVVIRSADAVAGHLFGAVTVGTDVARTGFGHAPGTLVEVDIVTDPPLPHELGAYWADGPTGRDDIDLQVIDCAFDPERGLSEQDQELLVATARRAEHADRATGLVVTIALPDTGRPPAEAPTQTVLRGVLDTVRRIAGPSAVVVVFPNADPRILDVSIAGLHSEEERTRSTADRAEILSSVLVLGTGGAPQWCGGPATLRRMLEALTEAGGALPYREARRRWLDEDGDPSAFRQALRGQPNLSAHDGQVVLRVAPHTVLRRLHEIAGRALTSAIAEGGPGVDIGLFRTPTLRVANRWVNVGRLLEGTIGTGTAAFVLARAAERHLRRSADRPTRIVVAQAQTAPERLTSQLSECLALGGRCYPMPDELDLDLLLGHDQVPAGAQVVLCVDLLSTENTARRAVAAIVRTEAIPTVITCVVDARRQRGPIEIFNRSIPVIALSEVVIDVDSARLDPATPVTDIDPILRRPVDPRPKSASRLSISEDELLDWCARDPGILRLGHIKRPPRVHFSAYLQVDRLLRNKDAADKIVTAVVSTVTGILAEWGPDPATADDVIQIWHPGTESDYAGLLAGMVRARLVDTGYRAGAPRAVPRGVAGDRWAFPPMLGNGSAGQPVVVVDWGTVSMTSVQQMIRLAAGAGASSIIAIALLNQITDLDTEVLVGYRAVAGKSAVTPAVPTAVRFVTATSIAGMPAHDCGICAIRDRYTRDSVSAPARLRRHTEHLTDVMRSKSREEVARTVAMDLFNVPISGHDVADYLRWRGLVQHALRETGVRQQVVDHLAALVDDPHRSTLSRDNLLRLLAAEQQWLKLPPLRFGVARDLLAVLCTASLASPTASVWLRIQALIVLTTASPERFVQQLPYLLAQVVNEPVLVDQILLDCHRLLQVSPQDSPIDIAELRNGLQRCRDHLEHHPEGNDTALLRDHRHVLSELIVTAKYHERYSPRGDAQAAWSRLIEDFNRVVVQHRLESDLLLVRGFVEDLKDRPPPRSADFDPRDDWDNCATKLVERVLINLPPLRAILAGDYVEDRIGQANQQRLLRLGEPNGITELQEVGDKLHRLIREPWAPGDPQWRALRRDLLARLNWWYRVFVAAHLPDRERPALLADLIGSAPTDLGGRVERTLNAHGVHATVDHADIAVRTTVFCPTKLLDEVVGHLLDNARRHGVPGADCRFHVDYRLGRHHTVQFVLRNTGSRPRAVPGRGLRAYNDKLAPFGAGVVGEPLADEDWTFQSVVTLSRWQGA